MPQALLDGLELSTSDLIIPKKEKDQAVIIKSSQHCYTLTAAKSAQGTAQVQAQANSTLPSNTAVILLVAH